jgi:hypothetical protein
MRTLVLAGLSVLLIAAAPGGAVIGGTPDGGAHPYVGFVWSSFGICSGSLVTESLVVTAAHCAPDGESVLVTVDDTAHPVHSTFVSGTFTAHEAFCMPCVPGLPGFASNDVAVVELDEPITLPRYAQLPELGMADGLAPRSPLTIVGYGVQAFIPGRGGRAPVSNFSRTQASVTLNPGNFAWRSEFIRISANRAAVCFGDSGGPNLVGDTMVAINSYAGQNCTGNTYSYRLDTAPALAFVTGFLP